MYVSDFLFSRYYELPQEQRADDFAIKHCPNSLDGGIYLFKTMQECRKIRYQSVRAKFREVEQGLEQYKDNFTAVYLLKIIKWAEENIIPLTGDDPLDFKHPLFSERIAHLESIKQQRHLNPLSAQNAVRM